MTAPRARRFCQALLEETRGEILRWASIDSVTERLGMDYGRPARWRPSSTPPPFEGAKGPPPSPEPLRLSSPLIGPTIGPRCPRRDAKCGPHLCYQLSSLGAERGEPVPSVHGMVHPIN